MVDLMRGLLGAVAGGTDAYGEILDEKSKAAKQKAKDLMDQKRQENYLKLQNDYSMARQKAGWSHEADVREEEEIRSQGILAEERSYQEGREDIEFARRKEAKEHEYGLMTDLATTKAATKGQSDADKKREEKNAFYAAQGKLLGAGGAQIEENKRVFDFPAGTLDEKKRDELMQTISSYGFSYNYAEDEQGNAKIILNDYSKDRAYDFNPSTQSPAEPAPTDDPYARWKAGRGKRTTEPKEPLVPTGLMASHETDPTSIMNLPRTPKKTVATPQTAPEEPKTLSPEISSWNVVQQTRAGKPVYIETNSGRLLSEEEYAAYVKYLQGQSSNLGTYLRNLPDTGAVQKRREQAQKAFLR